MTISSMSLPSKVTDSWLYLVYSWDWVGNNHLNSFFSLGNIFLNEKKNQNKPKYTPDNGIEVAGLTGVRHFYLLHDQHFEYCVI